MTAHYHFDDATKKQLLQIALHEECDLSIKYGALRELQLRQWRDEYLTDLITLWGKGYTVFQISIEMGIDDWLVRDKLTKYGLWKRRVV